jgi:DNA topoisomerase-1
LDTITFDEALKLFDLPRTIGTFEDGEVVIGIGKFGPYIRHNGKFTSLKADTDAPESIDLERAIELILAKRKADSEKVIQSLDGAKHIDILNGRFGPYISCGGKNFKIPKGKKPAELSYSECEQIMASQTTATKNKK